MHASSSPHATRLSPAVEARTIRSPSATSPAIAGSHSQVRPTVDSRASKLSLTGTTGPVPANAPGPPYSRRKMMPTTSDKLVMWPHEPWCSGATSK